jgi:hypothetical protein
MSHQHGSSLPHGPLHGSTVSSLKANSGSHISSHLQQASTASANTHASSTHGLLMSNRIDQLVVSELATAQKLLTIQQKDNYRFQEHVHLLDGEIDALKLLLEEKQLLINKKENEIDARSEQVRNLELELKAARLDIASFTTLADNFRALQQTLENKQIEIDQLTLTLQQTQKNAAEMEAFWKAKVNEDMLTEAKLTADIMLLTQSLSEITQKHNEADSEISNLRRHVSLLQQELKFTDETRSEQILRSRQTEYRTLHRADDLSQRLQRTIDEKETLQHTLDLSLFRGDILQQRLGESFEITDENHHVMETVVKSLEQTNAEAKSR